MDEWRLVVNTFVEFTGGREGWFGRLYMKSLTEQADERYFELEQRKFDIEMQQRDNERDRGKLEKRTKKLWDANDRITARQTARDLYRARVEYKRLGAQKDNVAAVASMIQQLRAGTATEDALEFYVKTMGERVATTSNPERFARVLERCQRLRSMQALTNEYQREFFDEVETEDAEEDADETSVDAILRELDCLPAHERLPNVIEVERRDGGGNLEQRAEEFLRSEDSRSKDSRKRP